MATDTPSLVTGSFAVALGNLINRLSNLRAHENPIVKAEVRHLLSSWDSERGTDWYLNTRSRPTKTEEVSASTPQETRIGDQTFHSTLVTTPGGWHYNHPEKGGPVRDPLQAMLTRSVDQHLGKTMQFARQTHPQDPWLYARLLVQVVPFDSQSMIEGMIRDRVREQALAKLSAEEREALGL